MLSSRFGEIFKNNFFIERLQDIGSDFKFLRTHFL